MTELADNYRWWDKQKKEKKKLNKQQSTKLLKDKGIQFKSYNDGVHLFVEDTYDFWPSTGKFKHRESGKQGRGVFNLLKKLKQS